MQQFYSHKEFGHEPGLSCCFRQHKATHSHCSLLHGYAISVRLDFVASELDDCNWVMDFGGFSTVKDFLKRTFDHKLLVAEDDPQLDQICALGGLGLADVVVLEKVGCEAFAKLVFDFVAPWAFEQTGGRVELFKVTIKEHGANGATYADV